MYNWVSEIDVETPSAMMKSKNLKECGKCLLDKQNKFFEENSNFCSLCTKDMRTFKIQLCPHKRDRRSCKICEPYMYLCRKISGKMSNLLYLYRRGQIDPDAWIPLVECTVEFLHKYLDSKRAPWMDWDINHGYSRAKRNGQTIYFEIDHISPMCKWSYYKTVQYPKSLEEVYKICNWSNLQLLDSVSNRIKSIN